MVDKNVLFMPEVSFSACPLNQTYVHVKGRREMCCLRAVDLYLVLTSNFAMAALSVFFFRMTNCARTLSLSVIFKGAVLGIFQKRMAFLKGGKYQLCYSYDIGYLLRQP